MKWELVNPSDYYTVESDDFRAAAAACLFVGAGKYGLEPIGDATGSVPLLVFGDPTPWLEEVFGTAKWLHWVDANRSAVVAALRTITITDEERSSLNNIGKYAAEWADKLESRGIE